jgi:hypothetical protein
VTDAVLCVPTDEQAPHAIARWRSRLSPAATLRTCTLPEDPGEGALACVVDAAKGLRPVICCHPRLCRPPARGGGRAAAATPG